MKQAPTPLATNRNKCPRCGKAHSNFISAPSHVADGQPFRIAPCGQRFTTTNTTTNE